MRSVCVALATAMIALVLLCATAPTAVLCLSEEAATPSNTPSPNEKVSAGGGKRKRPPLTQNDIAELKWKQCEQGATEPLRKVWCLENALYNDVEGPGNYTWWGQLSTMYFRSDLMELGHEVLNRSVDTWFLQVGPRFEAAWTTKHAQLEGKKNPSDEAPPASAAQPPHTWVDVLEYTFSDDFTEGRVELKAAALDMAVLLARKMEMEHVPPEAHAILYRFLLPRLQELALEPVWQFHRRTGNIIAMALTGTDKGRNASGILWRVAEAVQPLLNGLTEHLASLGDPPFPRPVKRMCGLEFTDNSVLPLQTLLTNLDICLGAWANFSKELEADGATVADRWLGSMRESALHRLAVLGLPGALETALKVHAARDPPLPVHVDRFKRTPLHSAAAWGRVAAVTTLLRVGGLDPDAEDQIGLTPRRIACEHPEPIRSAMATVLGGCGDFEIRQPNYVADAHPDGDDDDGSTTDGGWNARYHRPEHPPCDLDVLPAKEVAQAELMVDFVHYGRPVVLRNSFYRSAGPDQRLERKSFVKKFGKVLLRRETYPRQSRYGLGEANVTTIHDLLLKLEADHVFQGSVSIDDKEHPLADLIGAWIPPSFELRRKKEEVPLFAVAGTAPLLHLYKTGSQTMHTLRTDAAFHAVAFGHQQWWLLPPTDAVSVRGPLPEAQQQQALQCQLVAGDVLVIPELWSASWAGKKNGLSFERIVRKNNGPEDP